MTGLGASFSGPFPALRSPLSALSLPFDLQHSIVLESSRYERAPGRFYRPSAAGASGERNTLTAYSSDVLAFLEFAGEAGSVLDQLLVRRYLAHIQKNGAAKSSTARKIAGATGVFRFLRQARTDGGRSHRGRPRAPNSRATPESGQRGQYRRPDDSARTPPHPRAFVTGPFWKHFMPAECV